MPPALASFVVILLAYLIGSIPMAYVIARLIKGIDIRSYGSGNVGASNVFLHVGKWYIIPLGFFDLFVKGAFPVYLADRWGLDPYVSAGAGLATIAGHNWSLYLGFTGGRGIATALGVLFALAYKELIAYAGVTALGWLIFRSSALWWGISTAALPLWSVALREDASITVFCLGYLLMTALKRLTSNRGTVTPGTRWREVFVHRLLYDRDISSKDEWIHRKPTKPGG